MNGRREMMGGYQGTVCHHCGKPIDQLELCDCPRAMASHIRSRTSMTYVAEAFDSAANTIDRLRAEVVNLEEEQKLNRQHIANLTELNKEALETNARHMAEVASLTKENENLKAYAKHERSLGAEPWMLRCNDLTQQLTSLKEENGRAVEGHRAATKVSTEYAKQNRNLTQQLAAANGRGAELCKVARALDMAANHSVLEELPEVMREASKRIFAVVSGNGKTGAQMLDAALSDLSEADKEKS